MGGRTENLGVLAGVMLRKGSGAKRKSSGFIFLNTFTPHTHYFKRLYVDKVT